MDYKSLLFNIDIQSGNTPAPGALLVSEPFLREDYFSHSVIALIEYEPGGGAMGVVLNNGSDYTLQELVEVSSVRSLFLSIAEARWEVIVCILYIPSATSSRVHNLLATGCG